MTPSQHPAPSHLTQPAASVRNLVQLLIGAASHYGDRPFASNDDGTGELTFREFARQSEAVAYLLRDELGVQPGNRVALLIPNCTAFLPVYFGILWAGAVAVPVNIRLKPTEMQFILHDVGAAALFVHPRTLAASLEANVDHAPVVLTGLADGECPPEGILRPASLSPHPVTPADPESDDVASIIYTSGTTGLPKGAMLTHRNVLFNVESTIHSHGLQPDDIHLLVVPLFHVTGLNTILPTALSQGARPAKAPLAGWC